MSSPVEAEMALAADTGGSSAPHCAILDRGGVSSSLNAGGGVYLALRYGLGTLVSLGNMLVLSWWIGPHAYGVFVAAVSLAAFLASLSRAGVDTYLVRREEDPGQRLYDVAITLILVISTGLMLAGAAATPLLVRWYSSREIAGPYLALLLTVPLAGLAGPPTAKLERALNFRAAAGVELGGQSLALLTSVMLAWRGAGVWAAVTGQLVWQGFALVGACVAARLVPRARFDAAAARDMLRFGVGFTAAQRTWQLRTLVNPLLVGRFAGAEAVAFVAFAIRVAEGLSFVRTAAGRLAIAALARLQADREKFRAALEQAVRIQVLALGPLLVAFALLGPLVVPRLMGARWLPSLRVYPFIAAGVLINSVYNLQASALFVAGRQWAVMQAYACHVALLAAGTAALLPRFGIPGYGWAELLACGGYFFLQSDLAKIAPISYRRLAPWCVAFLLPLFAPLVNQAWLAALGLPLLGMVVTAGWKLSASSRAKESVCEPTREKVWWNGADKKPAPEGRASSAPRFSAGCSGKSRQVPEGRPSSQTHSKAAVELLESCAK